MIMAKIKLNSTPPTITSARCHAGLERNSHGFGSCLSISVSMDSSIAEARNIHLSDIIGAAARRLCGLGLPLSLLRLVGGRRFLVAVRFRYITRRMVLLRLAGMLRCVRLGGRTLDGLFCAGAVSIPAGIMLFTIRLAIHLYLFARSRRSSWHCGSSTSTRNPRS